MKWITGSIVPEVDNRYYLVQDRYGKISEIYYYPTRKWDTTIIRWMDSPRYVNGKHNKTKSRRSKMS